ncbi:hypothetical protein FZW96_07930 [Bacillus sp. BGMRC 2118]|nr:hypothetical protein FZW96_07930 [Bacillus sp. BGMRC 2118]
MGFFEMIVGFLFIFLDFTFQGVNVLPDFVGYFILFLAVDHIGKYTHNGLFTNLKKPIILLFVVSCIAFAMEHFSPLVGVLGNPVSLEGQIFWLLFFATRLLLKVYVYVLLCKGIYHESIIVKQQALAAQSRFVMKMAITYEVALVIFMILVQFNVGDIVYEGEVSQYIAGALFVFAIVVFVLLVRLINHTERVFAPKKEDEEEELHT